MFIPDGYDGVEVKIIDPDYVKIKHSFKSIIKDLGIQPGTYNGIQGRDLLRKIQPKIYQIIENLLYKYRRFDVHNKLFKCYSDQLYKKYLTKELVKGDIFTDWEDKQQQAYKYVAPIELLILINLYCDHNEESEINLDDNVLTELIGIAFELNAIQLDSDSMSENDRDFLLVVGNDYIYNLEKSDGYKMWARKIAERKRNYEDFYSYSKCFTEENRSKFDKAFFTDTGVDYNTLFLVLSALSSHDFLSQFICIAPNVYCSNKTLLIERLENGLETDSVSKAIDFLTLDQSKIKWAKGEEHAIIPLWNRKERTERIDTRPIIEINGSILLSTPFFFSSIMEWGSAFPQLCLPFELGLSETKSFLDLIAKDVQEDLVEETQLIFQKLDGFKVDKNVYLHKRDRNAGFPLDLGDYDVIAVNESLKLMFIIECKNLGMCKTIHEVYSKDKHFFEDQKNCEKFNKRIDYCKNNYHLILKAVFNIEDNSEYTIIPIMLFNRVIEPIKPISGFKILSFHEFYSNPFNFI